jgi:fibronectin-binding autotransporter adhesin
MLTLQGGAGLVGGTLDNSGTLEIASSSGATLDGVTITGSGSIEVDVAMAQATPTLVLDDDTVITHGSLTVGSFGTLDIKTAGGATFHGVNVTNDNSIEVFAGSVLILDQVTTVDNSTGVISIDGTGMLTLDDASISGGAVSNNGTLTLGGTAALKSGTLSNYSQINVSATDNELDSESITNTGAIAILALGALTLDHVATFNNTRGLITVYGTGTLTLNDATISGGTIDDYSQASSPSGGIVGGDIDVTGSSMLSSAHLNNGQVTIESGVVLTLDNDAVTGTHFSDTGATIQVDGGTTLNFSDATITGGTINDYSTGASGSIVAGDIDVTDSSTISDAHLINGLVTIESGVVLTLDNDTVTGTHFSDTGATIQIDGGTTLTLEGGTIVTGGTITIKDGSTLDTEHGTNGFGATLDGVVVHNSGTVQVGTNADHTATLTLDDGTTITGGTLTIADGSTLEVSYGKDGTGATLDGVSVGNSGTIQVGAIDIDPTLTLDDGTSVTGGTLLIGSNSTLDIKGPNGGAILDGVTVNTADSSSTIAISDGATLTLHYASIDGGLINDYSCAPGGIIPGDIDVTGSSTISDASLKHGNVTIEDGQTLTLDDVTVTGTSFTFVGSGKLAIGQPSAFTGEIAGISGSGDVLDLGGFGANDIVHAASGSYNSATNTTSLVVTDTTTDHSVTLTLAGDYSTSTWTVTSDGNGGVNVIDPPAPAAATIASGSSLEISTSASKENITFQGSTGSLTLDHPANFTGVISGFTGDGTLSGSDHIDLKGINLNSGAFTESYNATNDTLSVSDGTNSAVLHFNGIYQAANFSFTTDGSGGTIVYDPPVPDHSAAKTQAVTATAHGFVFNFAEHGIGANGAHPAGDTHIFDGQTFVNAEADLNKHHDDGHGHAAPGFDSPEPATIAAIKAQLHAHDFHFV